MLFFGKNIISAPAIKTKSDKLHRRALRDARKKIKKGELADQHGLALYLPTIDSRYEALKTDINNATRVVNYAKVRADKVAETRELLDFFSLDQAELESLQQTLSIKAEEAGRVKDFRQERLTPVDLTKLKNSFANITLEDN